MPFLLLLLAGLGWILRGVADSPADVTRLMEIFLPPHVTGPEDPFATAEQVLGRVAAYGRQVTLVAVPAFLWFSTRAFASIRTALNDIYDVSLRPPAHRGVVGKIVVAKVRDLLMVATTIALFLLSNVFSTGLGLLQGRGERTFPELAFLYGPLIRVLGEVLAVGSVFALFLLLYRYASPRRIRIQAALVASSFAAIAFEVARRLYAFYLTSLAGVRGAAIDAGIGAAILFVLWMYYSALVFLLGGVVAETWELRRLLRRHRAVLT